ncbi:hypothetical protein FDP41_011821 [Naegleria fowleri]|uniref:Uncharacterized protein n=1 Tax=Naegleria fowleri TaxID=5763 RepID=A0A6A5C834_NAEFO|nr:uncharacterized protein FDP41_011821 [Naegleria fowleri]KAF0981960.1 hypothetical protein FDP41_011821 [Naegleria fowleri]
MTRARTKSAVVSDPNHSSSSLQQRIQPAKKRSYTSTGIHSQTPPPSGNHSSSLLHSNFPPITFAYEENPPLHLSSFAESSSSPLSSFRHSPSPNSNLLQRRLSTTELSENVKLHSLLRRAQSPLPNASKTTHFHHRTTPNQYGIIVSNSSTSSSKQEKLDLYSKYIQKLRLELDKKSQLIKDLKEYVRKQDESIRISHDMYQKVLKHRCHGGERPSLEPSQELSQTLWENCNEEKIIDELFEEDNSEELLDEMTSRLMKYETKSNSPFSSDFQMLSKSCVTTSNASTQTFFESENEKMQHQMLLESINALKEVALSKQVKELKDQIQQYKTLYESIKDELISTRSEFVQYKMRLEEEREKNLIEIRNLSDTCKFEKNAKSDIYQSISSHFEEENKKNLIIIEKLKTDLKNRDAEKSSLEKLIETQQSLYNNLNERYNKETHQLRREIDGLRKKLSISMTRNMEFNTSLTTDSKNTLGSTATSDISSILQPSDSAQYMKSSRSSNDKSHRNELPKI